MKKILAILLCLVLVCGVFAGCGQTSEENVQDTSSLIDTSSEQTASQDDFKKPETFSAVVKVTINPEFNLYLDENGFVIAVEPLNDDAKTINITITDKNKEVKTFVKELVKETKEKGFLKQNATVKVETGKKENLGQEVKEIISNVKETFEEAASDVGVVVKVEIFEKKCQIPKD